jgi:hypothetical protein
MKEESKHFAEQNMYEGSKSSIYARPLINLIIALVLIPLGIMSYLNIRAIEKNEGELRLTRIENLLYDIGGKELILAVMLLASGILLYSAFGQWKRIKESLRK